MSLKGVYEKLQEIAKYSGKKDKDALISRYINEDLLFKKVVFYALHPFKKYNTTNVYYQNSYQQHERSLDKLFQMLEYLSSKKGANDAEIDFLSFLASYDKESVEVVRRIVIKDLRCGSSLKTFRKFIPQLPEFSVMLCERKVDDFFDLCNNDLSQMRLSLKLDGVRCTTNNGIYLSRNGKEFPNFDVFNDDIKNLKDKLIELFPRLKEKTFSIDGEIVADTKDHEFEALMTQVQRLKNVDTSKLSFVVFDITLDDTIFDDRYEMLNNTFHELGELSKTSLLQHPLCSEIVSSKEQLLEYANYVIDLGYEGLVLKNINSYYERKKSRNWLKIKRDETIDCEVIDWVYGEGKNSNVIGALVCRLNDGTEFNVSGMTDQERVDFMYDLPKIIEIEYQDFTKKGKPRFPRIKRRRDDKNSID